MTNQTISDPRRRFSGPHLLQIAMPMGGIGAGSVCLSGNGGLQDFSIYNKPAITALADGHGTGQAAFAILHVKSETGAAVTRLIEGPMPLEKIYDQGLQAQGYRHGGHEGLPRFASCEFVAEYPFGHVHLSDPKVPLDVTVTGWSPFIPLDDLNTSIPCALLDYHFKNTTAGTIDFEFSFHLSHPAVGKGGWKGTRTAPTENGVLFTNTDRPNRETWGSTCLSVIGLTPSIKASWLRGGWFDGLSALWREVSSGQFRPNVGTGEAEIDGRNGGSVLVSVRLAPGESLAIPVALTWYFPNLQTSYGSLQLPQTGQTDEVPPCWRPFYAGEWSDAGAVAGYISENYASLRERTRAFADALFGSTLPPVVVDAAASNLAILKSPTVLRQENGNVWAWEGCFPESGCCHGSCTHVWNYAQALPHLFPALERTLREQEFLRSMDDTGHINFRSALPDGPTTHNYHPAADGQLGGIMKLYRDVLICGDVEWLRGIYPHAKKSIGYCIAQWDPEEQGTLSEPHHNTYDIEFWGPDGMCTTIYIGALSAMAAMTRIVDGDTDDAARYETLAQKAARYLDDHLYNGEYFFQKVQWDGLRDQSFAKYIEAGAESWDEVYPLLKAEGPKYQYGTGCISDGVIGAWMAGQYGIETPMSREHVRSHLRAIFAHNFKADLSEHACTQRPGYATGKEPGLLLCTWPRGEKPTLPFVYSDEVWTGIEHQVAAHLIAEGMVNEGLAIEEAVRAVRYDGHIRNPFNEYECGSYYARALASWALLPAYSGFRYDAVTHTLTLAPKTKTLPFRTFFSTGSAWGTLALDGSGRLTVSVIEGELPIHSIRLGDEAAVAQPWGIIATPLHDAVYEGNL